MNSPENQAKIIIEKFYQASPEIMGTGRAYQFGIEMAIVTVDIIFQFTNDLIYWGKVKECLEMGVK